MPCLAIWMIRASCPGRHVRGLGRTGWLTALTILHLDEDFEILADITGQPVERLKTG